jgi:hypothetical protein
VNARRFVSLIFAASLCDCTPLKAGTDTRPFDAGPDGPEPNRDAAALEAGDSSSDAGGACPPLAMRTVVRLPAAGAELVIDADTRWSCQNRYVLAGRVFVTRNATLTIDAGVEVQASRDAMLLVTRGARLVAVGRRDAPIVFTSDRPVGMRAPRDWRGLVLLGNARTHDPTNAVVDATTMAGDARGYYGGGASAVGTGTCGTLRYVRVEFAGGAANESGSPGAALSLAGCGSDTVVDSVQVHRGSDGVGLYGGEAPLTRLLVTGATSDGIEWVKGYRGRMQFVIVQHRSTGAGSGAALKANNAEGAEATAPISAPTVFNATLVGVDVAPMVAATGEEFGVALQFGSHGVVRNSVVVGFESYALDARHPLSAAAMMRGEAGITHSIFFGNGAGLAMRPMFPSGGAELDDGDDDDANVSEDAIVRAAGARNRFVDPQLSARRTDLAAPAFGTTANVIEQDTSLATAPGMTATTYVGALAPNASGEDDWTLGWTAFPAN